MIRKNKVEILAPAGSYETLEAVLRCGAEAVYVGGKYFSARGNAKNFTDEELKKASAICHLYGAKLYIAVNTVIFDSETAEFCRYIKYTAKIGVDAYIVQDWGCIKLIKNCIPDAVIHASTQMTIHTLKGAELAKSLGFSRIVPARELSFEEIRELKKSGLEIEMFLHGALCMSISGQCYMSAMIGSRSANRGVCGQACRLPFTSCGNKNFCSLSLKDMSLLCHMKEISEIGIDSLKIEGRMKRPEYSASVVTETKKALEGIKPDMKLLRGVFSRDGFTDGYFTGKRTEMFGSRNKSDVVSAKDLLPKIRESYRKQPKIYGISFRIIIKENQNIKLIALCNELSAEITGDIPEKALNLSTDLKTVEKQLSKLGDTIFEYRDCEAEIDEGLIVPASVLNKLRREVVEKISSAIINKNTPSYNISEYTPKPENKIKSKLNHTPEIRIKCMNTIQAKIADSYADIIILPVEECKKAVDMGIDIKKICISPPRFITNEDKLTEKLKKLFLSGIEHILCVNPAYIQIGKEIGFKLHGDFGLNVTNSFSCDLLTELGLCDITLSFELKISQLKKINSEIPVGIIAYGRLPLMLTRNCPIKNEIGCSNCKRSITDRTGRVFPVNCCGDYVEILNSDTLCLSERDFSDFDFITLTFNNETETDIKNILKNFGNPNFKPPFSTKGLYYRGILNETENKKD